jgi:hypothetical protein
VGVKPTAVLLLQIVGLALISAAGFAVTAALGLALAGAGLILFSLAWERN